MGVAMKEPSVIYLERPQKKASYTIHIEVPPNPFWASIGLTVTPLPVGSGTQYKSEVSLGYLNQSFQMPSWRVCVMEWSRAYMAGE